MDDFDLFSSPVQQTQNTNIQEDDLFGSDNTDNVTVAAPTNTFSNDQQEDPSWVIENNSTNTTTASHSNIFGDDPLDTLGSGQQATPFRNDALNDSSSAPPQATSFGDDTLNDLSSASFGDDTFNDLSSAPLQTTQLSDNTFDNSASAAPQATYFGNDMFPDQPTKSDIADSYSTKNVAPTGDDVLYNDTTRQKPEETSSYDMFSNPASSPSTNTNQLNSTGISSTENLSPLQAFNVRRQQEIAEKDVEEQRKIEELRQQAKQDLERWYKDRQARMQKQRQTIDKDEDILRTTALQKSAKDSCDWSKIIRFLEFAQGTQLSKGKRDLNRMKASIIHAKRDKDNQKSENGP